MQNTDQTAELLKGNNKNYNRQKKVNTKLRILRFACHDVSIVGDSENQADTGFEYNPVCIQGKADVTLSLLTS